MIGPTVSERRESIRLSGSHPVRIWDQRRRMIGRGRTANLSEHGVFVLLPGSRKAPDQALVLIEIDLPRTPVDAHRRRKVLYRARVVRAEQMGRWLGVGLKLLEKIG